jgi:outer membrane protein OmpA-like peptidoglycan-associated protein
MKHIIRSTAGALVAGMIAAGCSTSPPAADVAAANTAISNAGQAIDHAAADPHVAKYAPGELERATDSLQKAKSVWNQKHDVQATTQLASQAQQGATAAQELANTRAAEDAAKVAAAERERAEAAAAAAQASTQPPAAPSTAQQDLAGFASGKEKVPTNALPTIGELAAMAKNNPDSKVVIEGHTDNVGSPAYNQALAMSRAQAVRSALVRQGVDVSRITVRSLGEENPVASNDTREGRRENRRAQVIIGGTETMVGSSQGGATSSGGGQSGETGQSGQSSQSGQSGQTGQSGQSGQSGQTGQSENNGQRGQ